MTQFDIVFIGVPFHVGLYLGCNCFLVVLSTNKQSNRGSPNSGYGFGYGAETVSKMNFSPVSVSANVVSVPSFRYGRKWNLFRHVAVL